MLCLMLKSIILENFCSKLNGENFTYLKSIDNMVVIVGTRLKYNTSKTRLKNKFLLKEGVWIDRFSKVA